MNILIIEDEEIAAERLENQLLKLLPDCNILAKIGSIRQSVRWFTSTSTQPDLIFLDIQLSDGLSFTIFERVNVTAPIIFTTAYDQYAIKAFQLNSISYLLKPIREKDLQESLAKYRAMKTAFSIDFESLLANYQGKKPEYKKRFLIRMGEKLKKIEVSEIAYFFAMEKSVFIKTYSGKSLPCDYTLDALEELLDPEQFFRINRSFLVQMEAIKQMVAWSRSRIKLDLTPRPENPDDTVVSVERSPEFKKWLNS